VDCEVRCCSATVAVKCSADDWMYSTGPACISPPMPFLTVPSLTGKWQRPLDIPAIRLHAARLAHVMDGTWTWGGAAAAHNRIKLQRCCRTHMAGSHACRARSWFESPHAHGCHVPMTLCCCLSCRVTLWYLAAEETLTWTTPSINCCTARCAAHCAGSREVGRGAGQ
jgi:hypothetical protein